MIEIRTPLCKLAFIVFSAYLYAQPSTQAKWIQRLLPPEARIIETADLKTNEGQPRSLVLWMLHPTRVKRHREALTCSDDVYGDHWYGLTRLSLLDAGRKSLINTIEVQDSMMTNGGSDDGFAVPYFVSNIAYEVPRADRQGEGAPLILSLKDLTGEGVAGQFVLASYVACGISGTSVFGYSSRRDQATQYQVEINEEGEKPKLEWWVPRIFHAQPVHPGQWDYSWEPGHGCDCIIHDQVEFDRARQVFVDQRRVTPYASVIVPKPTKQ
ncbi:MAG: hypothetical protein QM757_17980 [Paludibaculum sp.]